MSTVQSKATTLTARELALLELDDVAIKKLILEVNRRKCLWDEEDIKYTNDDRKKAWDEVHQIIQCDRQVAKDKWRTLQRQMKRTLKTCLSLRERESDFPYYKMMSFMEDKVIANIILEEQRKAAKLQSQSHSTALPVTSTSSTPTLNDARSFQQQSLFNNGAELAELSDEDYLASSGYWVSMIHPRDIIEFRTDVLKLLRYHRYRKNEA